MHKDACGWMRRGRVGRLLRGRGTDTLDVLNMLVRQGNNYPQASSIIRPSLFFNREGCVGSASSAEISPNEGREGTGRSARIRSDRRRGWLPRGYLYITSYPDHTCTLLYIP